MRKIRLTETQLSMLAEEYNILDDYERTIEGLIKKLNAVFGRLAFSNVAEIIENDVDLGVIEQELGRIEGIYSNKTRRMNDYFNRFPEDVYEKHWREKHQSMENLAHIVTLKQNFINNMLKPMKVLVDLDYTRVFSDIDNKKI